MATDWQASTAYAVGDEVVAGTWFSGSTKSTELTVASLWFVCSVAGDSGSSEPSWTTTVGGATDESAQSPGTGGTCKWKTHGDNHVGNLRITLDTDKITFTGAKLNVTYNIEKNITELKTGGGNPFATDLFNAKQVFQIDGRLRGPTAYADFSTLRGMLKENLSVSTSNNLVIEFSGSNATKYLDSDEVSLDVFPSRNVLRELEPNGKVNEVDVTLQVFVVRT